MTVGSKSNDDMCITQAPCVQQLQDYYCQSLAICMIAWAGWIIHIPQQGWCMQLVSIIGKILPTASAESKALKQTCRTWSVQPLLFFLRCFSTQCALGQGSKSSQFGKSEWWQETTVIWELHGFHASHHLLTSCFVLYEQTFRKPAMQHFLNSNELYSNSYLMSCGKQQRSLCLL